MGWAFPDGFGVSAIWPATRVVDMQAPLSAPQVRLATFTALWRAAVDQLTRGLVARFVTTRAVSLRSAARE
jgi:hypothetical protein